MANANNDTGDALEFLVPGQCELNFGLRWDFVGNDPIDLDASCVSFDAEGRPGEAVFFNNLATEGKWLLHTGDNTTGEGDDDDEAIQVFIAKVPERVHYLMFCVTAHNKGCYLSNVQSLECVVTNLVTEDEVCTMKVNLKNAKTSSSIVLCCLERNAEEEAGAEDGESSWILRSLNVMGTGHCVVESAVLTGMQEILGLKDAGLVPPVLDYSEAKPDVTRIAFDLKHLMMGIGWTREDCDLDSCAVMLDQHGEFVDTVHAKVKKRHSQDKSCQHSGDNAFDGQGDKETIHIKLDMVSPHIHFIYLAVTRNAARGQAVNPGAWLLGGTAGAYARLVHISKKQAVGKGKTHNVDDRKELCRTNIAKLSRETTALLFAVVYRDRTASGGWSIHMLEERESSPNVCIPGELLATSRCHSYFLSERTVVPIDSSPTLYSGDWDAMAALARRRVHLKVEVLEVRNLGPQDEIFKCQVFIWLKDRGQERDQRKCTSICKNRDHPQWLGETFSFGVTVVETLRFMVMEYCTVGTVDIPLFSTDEHATPAKPSLWEDLQTHVHDAWYPLQGQDVKGQLHVKMWLTNEALAGPEEPCCAIL